VICVKEALKFPALFPIPQPYAWRLLQFPVHNPIFGAARAGEPGVILTLTVVPVATKEYHTSNAGAAWSAAPPWQFKIDTAGLVAVAPTVVPATVTAAPF
jgi:hypothetical protein